MKRNKGKGFTLIELLAVIVILAIIALITVPIILNVIYKAEKGAFEDAAYGVIDAGRLHFTESLADTNSFAGKTFDFGTKDHGLKISGEKPGGGTLVLDGEGNQTLAVYDTKKRWCALKAKEEHKVKVGEYKGSSCDNTPKPTPTPTATPTPQPTATPVPTTPPGNGGGTIVDGASTSDGLYKDNTSSGGWIYQGKAPNNRLLFEGKCFSIIRIDDNKQIKIIYDGLPINSGNTCGPALWESWGDSIQWASGSQSNWNSPEATLRIKLEEMSTDQSFIKDYSKIEDHTWPVGFIYYNKGQTIETDLAQEKTAIWKNKIGMINPTDYVKSGGCATFYNNAYNLIYESAQTLVSPCKNNNYLQSRTKGMWTLNKASASAFLHVEAGSAGRVIWSSSMSDFLKPVVYLKSTVHITGNGTAAKPFLVS